MPTGFSGRWPNRKALSRIARALGRRLLRPSRGSTGLGADAQLTTVGEGTGAAPEHDREGGIVIVDDHGVELAVAIEVAHGDPRGLEAGQCHDRPSLQE
jgi:hypothetical protein